MIMLNLLEKHLAFETLVSFNSCFREQLSEIARLRWLARRHMFLLLLFLTLKRAYNKHDDIIQIYSVTKELMA